MSDAPLIAGVCTDCERPRSHHPDDGPCVTDNVRPCHGYRDQGVICGCDCACQAVLTEGTVMYEDVTADGVTPGETVNPAEARVLLLLCLNCYVGSHTHHGVAR